MENTLLNAVTEIFDYIIDYPEKSINKIIYGVSKEEQVLSDLKYKKQAIEEQINSKMKVFKENNKNIEDLEQQLKEIHTLYNTLKFENIKRSCEYEMDRLGKEIKELRENNDNLIHDIDSWTLKSNEVDEEFVKYDKEKDNKEEERNDNHNGFEMTHTYYQKNDEEPVEKYTINGKDVTEDISKDIRVHFISLAEEYFDKNIRPILSRDNKKIDALTKKHFIEGAADFGCYFYKKYHI